MREVSVFGGGAWGKALSFALGQKNKVKLISRRKIEEDLGKNVVQVGISEGLQSEFFIIAIASVPLVEWLKNMKFPKDAKIMCACKGINANSGEFVSQIMQRYVDSKNLAFLCGPSFALEVRKSLPCALVVHSLDAGLAMSFADLMPDFIKTYTSDDVIGGEVSGAYKNVISIAVGISEGMQLGLNAKAGLLSRGLVEMHRFGAHFGGKIDTFLGLSGAGDLFLTSSSIMSRNYRVGISLAKKIPLEQILLELKEVAEGVLSAKAIHMLATKHNIYTPIANEVHEALSGKDVYSCLKSLMK